MSVFVPEVEGQAKAFASLLVRSVREFFRDEQHRREFEDWYMKKHGKPYLWFLRSNAIRMTGMDCPLPDADVETQAQTMLRHLARIGGLRMLEE